MMKMGRSVFRISVVVALLLWLFVIPGGINLSIDMYQERDEDLLEAVRSGERKSVASLLAAGANPNAHETSTYASGSLWEHCWEMFTHTQRAESVSARTALSCACENRHAAEIVSLLLARGADAKVDMVCSQPGLCIAVSKGDIETVRLLLRHGADKNTRNDLGLTPLQSAVSNDNPQMVRVILEEGTRSTGNEMRWSQPNRQNYALIRQMIEKK